MKKIMGVVFCIFMMLLPAQSKNLSSDVCPQGSFFCNLCSKCLDIGVTCDASQCSQGIAPTQGVVSIIAAGGIFYCLSGQPTKTQPVQNAPTPNWFTCGSSNVEYPPQPKQKTFPAPGAVYAIRSGAIVSCEGNLIPMPYPEMPKDYLQCPTPIETNSSKKP